MFLGIFQLPRSSTNPSIKLITRILQIRFRYRFRPKHKNIFGFGISFGRKETWLFRPVSVSAETKKSLSVVHQANLPSIFEHRFERLLHLFSKMSFYFFCAMTLLLLRFFSKPIHKLDFSWGGRENTQQINLKYTQETRLILKTRNLALIEVQIII